MRILVVGSGGREHALCWAVRRELPDASLYCAPGNPGTQMLAENLPIRADDLDRLADAADMYGIDLAIVGPEVPLALGLADRLRAEGRAVFGPSAAAAQVESSKAFAKDVMHAAGVPTAASGTFTSLAQAFAFIDAQDEPLVVKASGLAAGKGAVVCATRREARETTRAMLQDQRFGSAGSEIVIEAFLEGEEVSIFALTDGRDAFLLPASQDHKRLNEGDTGPNTGGMGAYAPVSIATPALLETTAERVIAPTLQEMRRRGAPFSGLLYAGLMVNADGAPSVVEFNCRFGDPEAQVVLPLVSGGLVDAMESIARGQGVKPVSVDRNLSAVTTVLAVRGYPDAPEKGAEIAIPEDLPDGVLVFHAGTRRDESGILRANGGRVLTVTGVGESFETARKQSREAAEHITFEGKLFRSDIGWREGERRRTPDAKRMTHDTTSSHLLDRFLKAQEPVYNQVLAELTAGCKRTHWMWFVFPQIAGLGMSEMSRRYAIHDLAEARDYLAHPVLGARLRQCAGVLLELPDRSAHDIFGSPDDLKLRSCATLFALVSLSGSVFHQLLDRFFSGEGDTRTEALSAKR